MYVHDDTAAAHLFGTKWDDDDKALAESTACVCPTSLVYCKWWEEHVHVQGNLVRTFSRTLRKVVINFACFYFSFLHIKKYKSICKYKNVKLFSKACYNAGTELLTLSCLMCSYPRCTFSAFLRMCTGWSLFLWTASWSSKYKEVCV